MEEIGVYTPFDKDVLMPYDCVAHAIRLVLNTTETQDKLTSDDCAFEFEGHFRCGEISVSSTDIM